MAQKKNYLVPLAIIGFLFFTVGFALGLNEYLVPLLKSSLNITSGVSYLLIACTFSAFIIFGYPAEMLIQKIGYKKTMSISFFIFALGFILFVPSAQNQNLALFLIASFFCGTGNAVLQAAINPYITILGPIESAAKRISIMGICNKLAWPAATMFLAWVIGKSAKDATLADVITPFYIITGIFFVLGILVLFVPLEEIKAEGESEEDTESAASTYANGKTSIWQFPHLLWGSLSLFLYVGVETLGLATAPDYAISLGLANPEMYSALPSIGMVAGYILGILLMPKYLSQEGALRMCSWIGIITSILIVVTPPAFSIWCVVLIAFACSLIWPAIWPLSIVDLGKFTKTGAAFLVSSIAGGAVVPLIFGFLSDAIGKQLAYGICIPCFAIIMYFAYYGYKIRK